MLNYFFVRKVDLHVNQTEIRKWLLSCLQQKISPDLTQFLLISYRPIRDELIYECNKNNGYDTKRDKFAWYHKILTNRLQFIYLFVNPRNTASLAMHRVCSNQCDVTQL